MDNQVKSDEVSGFNDKLANETSEIISDIRACLIN